MGGVGVPFPPANWPEIKREKWPDDKALLEVNILKQLVKLLLFLSPKMCWSNVSTSLQE
jgi:hypothetical protein